MSIAEPFAPASTSRRTVPRPLERASRSEVLSHHATVALVSAFAAFLVAVALFAVYAIRYEDRVYIGVSVAGIDASGMTAGELRVVLDEQFADYAAEPMTLTAGDEQFSVFLDDLGVAYDSEATAGRVLAEGRAGTWWDRSIDWSRSVLHGSSIEPVVTVDRAAFYDTLLALSPEVISAPQDARIDMGGEEPTLIEDVDGISINVNASRAAVLDQVAGLDRAPVPLALISVPAPVQSADVGGGLPGAQRAVSGAFTVHAAEGEWSLDSNRLKELVWVDDEGSVQVRREGVQAFVAEVAAGIDQSAEDAGITVDENGAFVIVPAVNSATVDQEATTGHVIEALKTGSAAIDVVVNREEPAIVDTQAEEWAVRADQLVGDGVELTWSGESARLGRGDLIAALVIEPTPGDQEPFSLWFDRGVLAERMQPIVDGITIEAKDVQFRLVNGEIRLDSEAKQGRQVDVEASLDEIVQAVTGEGDSAPLNVVTVEPNYTREARASISLPDVLGDSSTYYGNSSDARRKNVERAVTLEDGWLIPPGGIFSYAEFMGLVTEENGFVTGFGIVADEGGGVTTAPVIGGGICQVSTTIFQAAFWAGLPIVERWAHPYWLESYGQPPRGMLGLDAMVNIEPDWALDLKFQNNTGNWIALVMTADGQNVRAEIRGVDPGWEIDVAEPEITNVVKPDQKMIYTESPELPKGQELQVERAREGFDSSITRTVRDSSGTVIDTYVLESTYAASRNTTLRGTGE